MNNFWKYFDSEQNFNLFIGDEYCKYDKTLSRKDLATAIFNKIPDSLKNRVLDRSSLSEVTQSFLDLALSSRSHLIQMVREFSNASEPDVSHYEKLLRHPKFEAFCSMNFFLPLEQHFYEQLQPLSPLSEDKDGSSKKPYYRLLGSIERKSECFLSEQDLKKLKVLEFYQGFWQHLRNEMLDRPTLLVGVDLDDEDCQNVLDFVLKDINYDKKTVYFLYSNAVLSTKAINFISKYDIKVIHCSLKQFENTVMDHLAGKTPSLSSEESSLALDFSEEEIPAEEATETEDTTEVLETTETTETPEIEEIPEVEEVEEVVEVPEVMEVATVTEVLEEPTEETEVFIDDIAFEDNLKLQLDALQLKHFPLQYQNFSKAQQWEEIIPFGNTNVKIGEDTLYHVSLRAFLYKNFRLLEFKTREFKFSLSVELFDNQFFCRESFLSYEISEHLINSRLDYIFKLFQNLFKGAEISFLYKDVESKLMISNPLEVQKFERLSSFLKSYEEEFKPFLNKKEKHFSSCESSFYELEILRRFLANDREYDAWIQAKVPAGRVEKGNKLRFSRRIQYPFKNLAYDLVQDAEIEQALGDIDPTKDLQLTRKKVKMRIQAVEKSV